MSIETRRKFIEMAFPLDAINVVEAGTVRTNLCEANRVTCNETATMYNLFVTSNFSYWEQNRSYELERGRAFEFPDADILDEYREKLITRKELPCFFSYEGFEGHGLVGNLESVREHDKVCVLKYQLDDAFPTRPILNEATYSRLGCSDFECRRTHWAVKD